MRKSFRLISLCSILLLMLSSCSSKVIPIGQGNPPLLGVDSEMQKFNMQLSFKKRSFSGMLIVQRRADCEIRMVASTYFGPTLFDFGLRDGQFIVYSCVELLQNHRVIQLFENDFKKLFLPDQKFRKTKACDEYNEKVSGRNFGKSVFQVHKIQGQNTKKVAIRHPWIGIAINLESL